MTRRYVVIMDLDDEPLDDRRRDFLHLLGHEGRARAIHEILERDLPGLAIQSVQEVATVDVKL